MKRSTKIWLTVAGCLAAAGLLLFGVGMCLGGRDKVRDWMENGELSWNFGWNSGFFGFHPWGSGSSVKFNDRYPIYEGTVNRARIEGAGQVEQLNFDIGGGRVEIKASEDDGYYFSSDDAKKYQCYAENGTLELREKGGSWAVNDSRDHMITIWLPKEADFQKIDIEIGGGILETEALTGKEFSIDVGGGQVIADTLTGDQIVLELGAGDIIVQDVEAEQFSVDIGAGKVSAAALSAQKLDMEIGAGEAVIGEASVHDVKISVGMGQIRYRGTITGDLDADCSMGAISLELTGRKEDHNYEIDCSMGEIGLDGESFGGMAISRTIQYNAASDFELDCSMGSISVTFAGEGRD